MIQVINTSWACETQNVLQQIQMSKTSYWLIDV